MKWIGQHIFDLKSKFRNDVTIDGDLTVSGTYTQIDTDVTTTEQWLVTNDGTGPAAIINQKGSQDIFDVQDDGTSVFYIEDGGNIGIGTTSPNTKIDIYDDSTTYAATILNNNNNGKGLLIKSGNAGGGTNAILDLADKSLNIKLRVVESGNVGIGTTSPTGLLSLNETPAASQAAPTLAFGDGDTGFYERFDDDIRVSIAGTGTWEFSDGAFGGVNAGNAILNNETATTTNPTVLPYRNDPNTGLGGSGSDVLSLIAGGVNGLNVISSGNVGIGTTSPASLLHVEGAVQIGVNDAGHDFTLYGDTANYNMMWDASSSRLEANDNVKFNFGTGNDLSIYHTGSHSNIEASGTGDLKITQATDDQDIIFQCDDGSGGTTAYLTLDGSTTHSYFSAGNVGIGTTSPSEKFHLSGGIARFSNSASNWIDIDGSVSGTNHAKINSRFNRLDIVTNTGGSAPHISLRPASGGNVGIGTTAPASLLHVEGTVQVGVDDTGHDVKFYGATAGRYLLWDESDDRLQFADNAYVAFGDGIDFTMYHNGTDNIIQSNSGHIKILNYADDSDIILMSDNGSGGHTAYLTLDGSASYVKFNKDAVFVDDEKAKFGTGLDLEIYHDGSNSYINQRNTGDLIIQNATDDKDIIFKSDDGSGGVTTYFQLDGGEGRTVFKQNALWEDSKAIYMGNGADLRLYHNGSNSFIENHLGNLTIDSAADDADIIFKGTDGGADITALTLDMSDAGTAIFNHDIKLSDSSRAYFGNSLDVSMFHNGTNSYIDNNNGDFYIRNYADDKDIIFQSDDGSGGVETYFFLDGSLSSGNPYTKFPDRSTLSFGDGNDLQIIHSYGNSLLRNFVGDLYITQYTNDGDIILSSDDGSGGITAYLTLDGSAGHTVANKEIQFLDNVVARFGTGNDLSIYHTGTSTLFDNNVGDMMFRQYADDKDIIFQSDDGAGGLAEYFRLDGSSATHDGSATTALITRFPDNSKIYLGTGDDGRLYHNGTDTYLQNTTGDLIIQNFADDKDIVFKSDDGSGGTETYFFLDGSANTSGNPVTLFPDNSLLGFGAGFGDLQLHHDGSNSYIKNRSVGDLIIQQDVDDRDLIFKCDDGSGGVTAYLTIDGSNSRTLVSKDFNLEDSVSLQLGNSQDLKIYHHSNHSYIEQIGTGNLYIRTTIDDGDIIFQSDDGAGGIATYFSLDGSGAAHDGSATTSLTTNWPDNSKITLGTSNDLYIWHNGTNSFADNYTGDFYIRQRADDKDLIFQSDDGSGGVTAYFFLDGSATNMKAYKDMRFIDNVDAEFGDGGDFKIYHDGSNTYLEQINSGTGNIVISNANDDADIIFKSDDGSGGLATYLMLDGSIGATIVPDSKSLGFGTGGDMYISHDTTNTHITNFTGDLYITNRADDKDVILRSDDGSGGHTAYLTLDGGAGYTTVQKKIQFEDSIIASFGNSGDFYISHNGSYTSLMEQTSDLYISNSADDKDIIFRCDDGSGGLAEYFRLDGGLASPYTVFPDDSRLAIGGGLDLRFHHDGGSSYIGNYTGNLLIRNFQDDGDIVFQSDDGSGGVETYFFLDGSASSGNPITIFPDLSALYFGTGTDLMIRHDGTDSTIANNGGDLYITQNTNDKDIIFQSDDGSGGTTEYFRLDGGATTAIFKVDTFLNDSGNYIYSDISDNSFKFADNATLKIGTGNDLQLLHDAANSHIVNYAGDLKITQNANDKDIIFNCDDGSGGNTAYLTLDGSAGYTTAQKDIRMADGVSFRVGSGGDARFMHNGSDMYLENFTGDLIIRNSLDDKDIIFQSDDGSGGVTAYLTLDGGDVSTIINTVKVLMPNLPTSDPSVANELWNDSGTLKISAG